MKPGFDIETYKTRFLGGARQYLFFVVMVLPDTPRQSDIVDQGGAQGGVSDSIKSGIKNAFNPIVSKYNSIGSAAGGISPVSGLGSSITNAAGDISFQSVTALGQKVGLRALNIFGLNKDNDMIGYHVRSTTVPGITFEEKVIDWPGLSFKMAGTATFSDWTVSFNIDEEGKLLQKFNKWQMLIGAPSTGSRGSITNYMIDQEVFMLNYNHDAVTSWKMFGCWPKVVGDIQFDYASQEMATVDITFSYQRYEVGGKPTQAVTDLIKRGFNRLIGN